MVRLEILSTALFYRIIKYNHMYKFFYSLCYFFIAVIFGCNSTGNTIDNTSKADAIYFDGDIINMEGDSAVYTEALGVKDGKIVFVGTKSEAELMKGDSTAMVDLGGKTLVPGFIDGHAHFHGFGAQAVGANLLAAPDGIVNDIESLVSELKSWYAKNDTVKSAGWIFGLGFDDAVMKEKRFLQRKILIRFQRIYLFALFIFQGIFVF